MLPGVDQFGAAGHRTSPSFPAPGGAECRSTVGAPDHLVGARPHANDRTAGKS